MNGLYAECYIKHNPTAMQKAGKIGVIAAAVLLLLAGIVLVNGVLAFLGIVAVIGFYFLYPMFDIAYEYVFVDGQIDFDKISGGEKRKNMLRIDLDNVEIMAPSQSHHLDSYRNQQGFEKKDFTSNTPDKTVYCIYMSHNSGKLAIYFEPDQKIIDYSRQKAPRKVFTD
ncbi:MAG: DUF6106 family protein [Lachnospiraceae bacterium]|nr:DUF6106 family protein [Lachnospiraceae bacterium]